ncbi:Type IV inositol polyphosphate 5-phosphatase 3 [Linum perenne]
MKAKRNYSSSADALLMKHSLSKQNPERGRPESSSCFACWCLQLFWPRVVVRKLLNIAPRDSDYSADTDSDSDYDSDLPSDSEEIGPAGRTSRFRPDNKDDDAQLDPNDALPRLRRRRKSETCRAQYISTKELRVRVATWNVGGKIPPDDLDIDDWVDTLEPADIYVLGLQEIVPLNAVNIFGAEDNRPVTKWENIIRDTLNRIRPLRSKVKCYSDPTSPSKFNPSDELAGVEEEIILESDSDIGEEVHPVDEDSNYVDDMKDRLNTGDMDSNLCNLIIHEEEDLQRQPSQKTLNRLNCIHNDDSSRNLEEVGAQQCRRLTKMLSGSERIGLNWPDPQLNLLPQHVSRRPGSFKRINSFTATKSFATYNSFKSVANDMQSGIALLAEIDLESLLNHKRRSSYVRIVSKQMVGIFVTVWIRRSLRKHIQNVKVSTVGVGVMGYIGNKGSISVSMSVYQTPFCFVCCHLTSGEKDGDELKRNSDVYEIHRRTHFHSTAGVGLPKSIKEHERIIWLGDLNYRINLSYERTRELIAKKEWSNLAQYDQLTREFRKGRAFDGWLEGTLGFPPTYKYENNSDRYYGEDPKAGRRTPAWCDRILSHGKGFKLLNYRRTELKLSDHRPVTATFMVEVEVFCARRLQRALTFTNAEVENEEVEIGLEMGMSHLQTEEVNLYI